jgi:hypothetical protein
MLKAIRNLWRNARSEELLDQVRVVVERIGGGNDELRSNFRCSLALDFSAVVREFGPLEKMAADDRLALSKMLHDVARKSTASDMGRAYGQFLLSAHVEAGTLLGPEAKRLQSITEREIALSLRTVLGENSSTTAKV